MSRPYHSEADKVRDLPEVMKYVTGTILDLGCGDDKITPEAIGYDGRALPGVNIVQDDPYDLSTVDWVDTVFSSHFLEHLANPYEAIVEWAGCINQGGHLVLYLPDGRHYNNNDNPEHLFDWNHDNFVFWIKRSFCGEGKDFKGEHLPKLMELVDHGMDLRENCYSFYVILRIL